MQAWIKRLLNDYQRDFPLCPQPYSAIGAELGQDGETIINTLQQQLREGAISRVGPVFKPNTIGVSTLAAMQVPAGKLAETAAIVSACPEVNHNYEREHDYNLWFVAAAAEQQSLDGVLTRVEKQTGYPVLSLPLVRDYHIDLGFRMELGDAGVSFRSPSSTGKSVSTDHHRLRNCNDLIAAIQTGLPLCARPYQAISTQLGTSEESVIDSIRSMLDAGTIKRFGVIVRHHELGYSANAMVVWDVPDEQIDALGQRLGSHQAVTLCYQRPRRRPVWPYNLFCMIHGKERTQVLDTIDACVDELSLHTLPREVLFSGRRFKQCGARYRKA